MHAFVFSVRLSFHSSCITPPHRWLFYYNSMPSNVVFIFHFVAVPCCLIDLHLRVSLMASTGTVFLGTPFVWLTREPAGLYRCSSWHLSRAAGKNNWGDGGECAPDISTQGPTELDCMWVCVKNADDDRGICKEKVREKSGRKAVLRS